MIRIFDRDVESASKAFFSVDVGAYANNAEVKIPVIVVNGKNPGPVFWIVGQVHGDELNGSIATWEYLRELEPNELNGTIVATPIANPMAMGERHKTFTIDPIDMDTSFPGNPKGTWVQRMSYILFSELKEKANYVLSFHTMASRLFAKPYTVSKIVPGADMDVCLKARKLAVCFGVQTNCSVDLTGTTNELPGVTSGALDILCMQAGIPAFMGEMGVGGEMDPEILEIAKTGIKNVLSELGMVNCERVSSKEQYLLTKRKFVRSDKGGLLNRRVLEPGTVVKKGELIGEIHNFGEATYPQYADVDYYVIGARKHPVTHTGERICFVGTEWKKVDFSEL